jgi:mono/diheme cytochrome c family protein
MKKTPHAITWLLFAGVHLSCGDDGMLIAEALPPEPAASESGTRADAATLEVKAVQGILQDNCGSCHGPSSAVPHALPRQSRDYAELIGDMNDIDALVAAGLIVPGLPEESRLVALMTTGQMPPRVSGLPRVSPGDVRQVERFILRLNPPTEREVEQILLRNCGSCHGDAQTQAVLAVNDIANIEVLVAAGLIVPGDRDRSPVYTRIVGGAMPPRDAGLPPVSDRDLARLGGFIDLLP